jgi:hypothetical protein
VVGTSAHGRGIALVRYSRTSFDDRTGGGSVKLAFGSLPLAATRLGDSPAAGDLFQ